MRPPNSPDTITDETRDSHNTFDTKFWDSFDVMLSCVFCWSQYLRVLILSCLSCSIAVIMVVTSTQTDRQSIYGVCHEWLNGAIYGPMGDNGPKAQTHKATRKFHANDKTTETVVLKHHAIIWCPCVSSFLVSIIHHDCLNQWMMNHQFSILYHFPLDCYGKDVCGLISSTVTYSGV